MRDSAPSHLGKLNMNNTFLPSFATLAGLVVTLSLRAGEQNVNDSRATGSQITAHDISKVTIQASHMNGGLVKTNLILTRSNSVFTTRDHSVPETAVSNLLVALQKPPQAEINPADLGLTTSWLSTNQERLLGAFRGETKGVAFPLASPRQREWLTNALLNLDLLGDLVRGNPVRFWTSDYPEIVIGFNRGDTEVARLHSRAQASFMLPWEVTWDATQHVTFNAIISRGVAALLPTGFLNRERIQGDLLSFTRLRQMYS